MTYSPGDPQFGNQHGENLCFLLPTSALKWLPSEIQPSFSIPYSPLTPSPQFLLLLLINHYHLSAQVCKANTIGAYR